MCGGRAGPGGIDRGGCSYGYVCYACVCVETRGQLPQELSALFLEAGSPTGVRGSLIRLGWQALDPLTHLPTSRSLSLILSDATEIKEDPEDQFSPLGF